jgi:hypothetical protein
MATSSRRSRLGEEVAAKRLLLRPVSWLELLRSTVVLRRVSWLHVMTPLRWALLLLARVHWLPPALLSVHRPLWLRTNIGEEGRNIGRMSAVLAL